MSDEDGALFGGARSESEILITRCLFVDAEVVAAFAARWAHAAPDVGTTPGLLPVAAHAAEANLVRSGCAASRARRTAIVAPWAAQSERGAEWATIARAIAILADRAFAACRPFVARLPAAIFASGRAFARATAAAAARLATPILTCAAIATRGAVVVVLARSIRAYVVRAWIAIVAVWRGVLAFPIEARINGAALAVVAVLGDVLTRAIHARVLGAQIAIVAGLDEMHAAVAHT